MSIKLAINGFGRIGKCTARVIFEQDNPNIKLVAINATMGIDKLIHMLKYDSVHGIFNGNIVKISENILSVNDNLINIISERNIENINWLLYDTDIVLECTGKFTKQKDSIKHINSGAKKVIISAPGEGVDATIICGVNDQTIQKDHMIFSIGSCTTNCLAPIVKILDQKYGIEKGYVTTIHSYTNDQMVLDGNHKDLRRARACNLSMIPTSTGAAKAISLVLPHMEGKLDGTAIRVPTPNVSMIDFNFECKTQVTADEINHAIKEASDSLELKNILGYCSEELVSIDFNHSIYSSYFDSTQTKVVKNNFVHVAAWYDNEWAFANRMVELATKIV